MKKDKDIKDELKKIAPNLAELKKENRGEVPAAYCRL